MKRKRPALEREYLEKEINKFTEELEEVMAAPVVYPYDEEPVYRYEIWDKNGKQWRVEGTQLSYDDEKVRIYKRKIVGERAGHYDRTQMELVYETIVGSTHIFWNPAYLAFLGPVQDA